MKSFFNKTLNFSSESYGSYEFGILPKLYELWRCCRRNPV